MAMNPFPLLAQHNRWANARLYDCVAALPEDAYRRDAGLFFGSIHGTLNHLLLVDRLWTSRIRRRDHGLRRLDEELYDDLAGLRAARGPEDQALIELVDGLSEARLEEPVRYRKMIGNGMEEARVGHILLTLFNHQTHHRGHVTAAVSQAGVAPPPLDIIFFTEETGLSGDLGTVMRQGTA